MNVSLFFAVVKNTSVSRPALGDVEIVEVLVYVFEFGFGLSIRLLLSLSAAPVPELSSSLHSHGSIDTIPVSPDDPLDIQLQAEVVRLTRLEWITMDLSENWMEFAQEDKVGLAAGERRDGQDCVQSSVISTVRAWVVRFSGERDAGLQRAL